MPNDFYIRQDTSSRKVFALSPFDSLDHVLYDFNLQVGDTFPVYALSNFCVQWNTSEIISAIDSVFIGNNYRKRWGVAFPGHNYIKGIGSSSGPIELTCINNPIVWLTCFTQNGSTQYPDTTFSCNIITSTENDLDNKVSVKIIPNPINTTATFILEGIFDSSLNLIFYDVMGRKVFETNIIEQSTLFDRKSLKRGLYFYRLINAELQITTGKFLIE